MIQMATLNTTELATELDTTPRELRKFLRTDLASREVATPGKGARYSIERREVRALKTRFTKWAEAKVASDAPADDAPDAD